MKFRLKDIDFLLLGSVLGLLAMGLVAIYSITQSLLQSGSQANYFISQIQWITMGLVVMLATAFLFPHRFFFLTAYLLYGGAIVLLILVYFWGSTGYGATRWLRIGGIGFQPSEFAKVATVLAVARYLSDRRLDINHWKTFIIAATIILVPFVLIARQPDLGTALVFAVLALPIIFWAGLKPENLPLFIFPGLVMAASFNRYAFGAVMVLLLIYLIYWETGFWWKVLHLGLNVGVGLLTPAIWNHLKDYQKQRILTFLNPEADPLGAGYQIIQSKVAIGSGGFFGKGFLHGSQTQLRFLPEQHTDFIFAVIGEEFGFFGVLIGLLLFAVLLCRIVYDANMFKNRFNSIAAIGFATILGFHMFVNVGMTVGLFPVTGLPLPFISYGGSAMLTNMWMIGLLLNFYRYRFEY
ncbi:MAG: rod shape-determining protein RodA [Calditrichaeota bacterium]|nr:MAG: rod shape-determining protein RodA [Calditrichota bacterium]